MERICNGVSTHIRVFNQLALVPDLVGCGHDVLDVNPEFLNLGSQEDGCGRSILRETKRQSTSTQRQGPGQGRKWS